MSSNQVQDKFSMGKLPDSDTPPPADMAVELTRLQDREKILLAKLNLYKLANRAARLGLWIVEQPEKRIIWSDEACLIHEIPIGSIPTLEQAINFYAPESRPRIQEVVNVCLHNGTPFNEELQLITAKGTRLTVRSIGQAIRNDAGAISKIQVVLQDISDINRTEANLRASDEKLRGLYELSPMGILLCDMQGNFIEFNEAFCRICGYTSDELSRLDYWTLTPKEYADKETEALDSLAKKGSYGPYIKEYIRKDGSRVPLQLNGVLIKGSDGQSYIWSIIEDITERKQAENRITEFNLDLERRVVERTEQLEAANKELEAFSYSVSHDLRAPLRAIDGFSHILLDDYADKLDDEGRRLLNVVRDNTSRMGQLINDILKFSRTGRVELTFSEIDMEKLAHAVIEELQPAVGNGKLQLEIEPIPPAKGDSAMMRQVFVNLLSNAIKFSRSKEVAMIRVGGSIEGDEVIYYVKDHGTGFDMEYADKLFGVFQRLHGSDEFEGTGIGLAIVKRIITRHGGRVWAEGKVNEGATIYFALPIQ